MNKRRENTSDVYVTFDGKNNIVPVGP